MKQFNINQKSTLPYLEIEPTQDGKTTYKSLCYAIQAADVFFSMTDIETGIKKVANAPAEIVVTEYDDCSDRFFIRYKWKKRDTDTIGRYRATFRIVFKDSPVIDGMDLPHGELIVPIQEDIIINVQ